MATNVSTPKGTAIFSSRQDRELFDIMHVVKAPDAKRAYLRSAVERFPRGLESMRSGEDDPNSMAISDGGPRDLKQDAEERTRAIAPTRVADALTALRENPKRPCRW